MLFVVRMPKMSDGEEDSGVHSELQDERMDLMVDNEGIDAIICYYVKERMRKNYSVTFCFSIIKTMDAGRSLYVHIM